MIFIKFSRSLAKLTWLTMLPWRKLIYWMKSPVFVRGIILCQVSRTLLALLYGNGAKSRVTGLV